MGWVMLSRMCFGSFFFPKRNLAALLVFILPTIFFTSRQAYEQEVCRTSRMSGLDTKTGSALIRGGATKPLRGKPLCVFSQRAQKRLEKNEPRNEPEEKAIRTLFRRRGP